MVEERIPVATVGAVKHALRVEGYGADAVIVQGMEGGDTLATLALWFFFHR